MRIISISRLKEFWRKHEQARGPLEDWYRLAQSARWKSIQDVRQTLPSADLVKVKSGKTVIVFNIGGNKYRLVVAIHYNTGVVYILEPMTHDEYSKEAWKERY